MKKPLSKRERQLIKFAGELAETSFEEARSLGFMSRLLLMVNLPYRDPGKEAKTWWRKNGSVTINVTPAYTIRRQGPVVSPGQNNFYL